MDAEDQAYWDGKFLLWIENLKPATPEEMEGLSRKVLATSECIQALFRKGMPVSVIAESCLLPPSVIEWWLRIALMPHPYPPEAPDDETPPKNSSERSRSAADDGRG